MKYMLRPYQQAAVEHLHGSAARAAITVMSPGSGKSLVLKKLVHSSPARIRVLVTPKEDVEASFRRECEISDQNGKITVPEKFWVCPRTEGTVVETFKSYLQKPSGRAFITTHAGWVLIHKEKLYPKSMGDWLFAVDEVHHSGAMRTLLYEACNEIISGGGLVRGATATPLRSDERSLFSVAEVPVFPVPYTQLVALYSYPSDLDIHLIPLPSGPDSQHFETMAQRVKELDVPTVINVPAGDEGDAARRSKEVKEALVRLGFDEDRVLDAVNDKEKFIERLATEQVLTDYQKRTFDVVVACKVMGEATDWPFCAHVICMGVTDSLPLILQQFGRSLRCKSGFANHPSPTRSTLTLFTGTNFREQGADVNFAAQLLLIAGALEVSPTAVSFMEKWDRLVRDMRLPPAVRNHLPSAFEGSPAELAQMKLDLQRSAYELVEGGHPPTRAGLIEYLGKRKDVDRNRKLFYLLTGDTAKSDSRLVDALIHRVEWAISRAKERIHYNDGPPPGGTKGPYEWGHYEDAIYEALKEVAADFKDQLLAPLPNPLRNVKGYQGKLDQNLIRKAVESLTQKFEGSFEKNFPSDEKIATEVIDRFHADHGHSPTVARGRRNLSYLVGFQADVHDLDAYFKARSGKDPYRMLTLSRFCLLHRMGHVVGTLDEEDVRATLKKHKKKISAGVLQKVLLGTDFQLRTELSSPRWRVGKYNVISLYYAIEYGWKGLTPGSFWSYLT